MKKLSICVVLLGLLLGAGSAFSDLGDPAFSAGRAEKAPECVKDGVKYGITKGSFRSEWWNYLERGTSYLEGACYEAALNDLDRAIDLRRQMVKNERDKKRARTYGLHFVDYFAHREKGIALYYLGRSEEAQAELEQSLDRVDTERARQYLALVKEARKNFAPNAEPKADLK